MESLQQIDGVFVVLVVVFLLLFASGISFFMLLRFLNKKSLQFQDELQRLEQEKKKALITASIQAQESERRRIGQNIHDDIGPVLALVSMGLAQAKSKEKDTTIKNDLSTLRTQTNEAIQLVRNAAQSLFPTSFQKASLTENIRDFLDNVSEQTKIEVRVSLTEPEDMIDSHKLNTYRMCQEMVNNAIRHSGASSLSVTLTKEVRYYTLEVADDGKGFENQNFTASGVGMRSLEARATIMDATLSMKNHPKSGAIISVKIPRKNIENDQ